MFEQVYDIFLRVNTAFVVVSTWLDQNAGILWGLAAAVFLLLGIVTLVKIWPALSKAVHIGDAIIALPKIQTDLETIKHQVLPNGGGSLRDDVTALNTKLGELETQQLAQHKSNVERVNKLSKHLTDQDQSLKKVALAVGVEITQQVPPPKRSRSR